MFPLVIASLTGLGIGLQSAVSPGPLMAMILGESVRSGRRAGIRIGLIPLWTDPIMITIALLVVSRLPDYLLGLISLFGAGVLIRLGWLGLRAAQKTEEKEKGGKGKDEDGKIKKNKNEDDSRQRFLIRRNVPKTYAATVAMNFLNPNLYIFSFSVHSIQMIQFWKSGFFPPIAYLLFFFLGMCGVNTLIAVLAGTFSSRLSASFLNRFNLFFSQFLFVIAALFVLRGLFFFF